MKGRLSNLRDVVKQKVLKYIRRRKRWF